ncbi:MAG: pyridoxal kinase PdxY [Bdellovibrionota bacterium]
MSQQKILSVQSFVSSGYVGNSAVTFPLQRLGVQVCPIHTVMFSNHTGYGAWRGKIFEPALVEEVFVGMKERGALVGTQALLTGYMGSKELGLSMIRIIRELKQINPDLLYCCDPVIGDVGRGIFVREGVPEFFKNEMLQYADIITPNHFELEYLSGNSFHDLQSAVIAAKKVMENGPSIVVVTSLRLREQSDKLHVLVVDKNQGYLVTTPLLPVALNGTGDLTSALFTHFYLKEKKINVALEQTVARVYSIIAKTLEARSRELVLVEAQEQLVSPAFYFKATEIKFIFLKDSSDDCVDGRVRV